MIRIVINVLQTWKWDICFVLSSDFLCALSAWFQKLSSFWNLVLMPKTPKVCSIVKHVFYSFLNSYYQQKKKKRNVAGVADKVDGACWCHIPRTSTFTASSGKGTVFQMSRVVRQGCNGIVALCAAHTVGNKWTMANQQHLNYLG
jgi:hypothetical protein